MGRAPCCEKLGLKRGPWTPEEDQLLIAYIQKFGHGNWRALPKLAGLLRCGKSCRLRWTNYLRPDIKRGNFSKEEEETIIKLHELLGNRWSTIAARLPGRTDNEIKNVWHTHLKKRLKQVDELTTDTAVIKPDLIIKCESSHILGSDDSNSNSKFENQPYAPLSPPQPSSSDFSSGTESATTVENQTQKVTIKDEYATMDSWQTLPQTENEHLWSDVIPMEQFLMMDEAIKTEPSEVQFPASASLSTQSSMIDDGIDFWNDLFANSEELPELPEF